MRIAFVSSFTGGPWSGCEELWTGTALRLLEGSHQVSACVKYWPEPSSRMLEIRESGVELSTWREDSDQSLFYKIWREIGKRAPAEHRRLVQFRPDLVVISQGSHTDGLPWMQFCRAAGLPYVAISHCNSEIWWIGDGAAAPLAEGYLGARKACCHSRHNLELLEWQIGGPLPNAMLVWAPFKAPKTLPAWPREDVMRIACVTGIDPSYSGHDLLMHLMAIPKWRERPLELNIYGGTAPYSEILLRMTLKLGLKNVRFLGEVADVNSAWKNNHLLILPSRVEGMPVSLVEAMMNARPAVVTDVGGNKELVVDGETGFVARAPTVELLDEAMERAWGQRDKWETMGKAALARIQKLAPADPVGDFCRLLEESVSQK